MKKCLILMGLLFILCGCTAEVNLNISNDVIKEEVSVNYFEDGKVSKNEILSSFRKYIPAYNGVVVADTEPDEMVSGVAYYKREVKDLGSGYSFKYSFDFPINNYNNARTFKRSFQSGNVVKNKKDKTITISTSTNGLMLFNQYDNLTSVVVNIKTNNEVIETNGTLKDGVYTWKLNRNDNKNIYMKLKIKDEYPVIVTENKTNNSKQEKEDNVIVKLVNKNPLISILVILGIFVIILLIITKLSRKKYD